MLKADEIAIEALLERDRQIDSKGWTPNHDLEHGELHLHLLVQERLPQLDWIAGEMTWIMPSRQELIEAIALLIAAVEVRDETEENKNA